MTSRTRQTTFDESLGSIRIKNTDSMTIPAYSIVAIGEESNVTAGAMKREGDDLGHGPFVVDVRRADARSIATGSPGQFLFTLGASIKAGAKGRATASLPVWVEVDSTITDRGTSVMPIADEFKLFKGGGFYTVMDLKSKGSDKKYAFIRPDNASMIRARTPSGGIAIATSDSQFPSAVCDLYHVIDDGTTVRHFALLNGSTPIRARVCNMSRNGAIPGSIFVGVTRMAGGALAVTWQDCG